MSDKAQLLAVFERRKAHIESNLKFWMGEVAKEGDPFAEAQMRLALGQLSAVNGEMERIRPARFILSRLPIFSYANPPEPHEPNETDHRHTISR